VFREIAKELPSKSARISFWGNAFSVSALPQVGMDKKLVVATILFIVGLCTALSAAALLLLDIIASGVAAVIGIVGIGLIGAAGAVSASRS
jgi:hypothetical protein